MDSNCFTIYNRDGIKSRGCDFLYDQEKYNVDNTTVVDQSSFLFNYRVELSNCGGLSNNHNSKYLGLMEHELSFTRDLTEYCGLLGKFYVVVLGIAGMLAPC